MTSEPQHFRRSRIMRESAPRPLHISETQSVPAYPPIHYTAARSCMRAFQLNLQSLGAPAVRRQFYEKPASGQCSRQPRSTATTSLKCSHPPNGRRQRPPL